MLEVRRNSPPSNWTLSRSLLHDNSVYRSLGVITLAESRTHPAVVLIERDSSVIWFGNFQEQFALRFCFERPEQRRSDTAPAECGIDGQVQEFGLSRGRLPPCAETGRPFEASQEQTKPGIIADGPLRGFGRGLLNSGDCGVIALSGVADGDGGVRNGKLPLHHVKRAKSSCCDGKRL